eukprot:scaffold5391_cov175-Alexandrium_tamarense.AAC.4
MDDWKSSIQGNSRAEASKEVLKWRGERDERRRRSANLVRRAVLKIVGYRNTYALARMYVGMR